MQFTTSAGSTRPSAAIGLILEAAAPAGERDTIDLSGLPLGAVHLPDRDLIVAATTVAAPRFGDRLETIAAEYHLDVVLLRLGTPGVIGVDFALGSLPCAVWAEFGFALYLDACSTWLVPPAFGPAVSVGADGCRLEIVPPYATLDERAAGIARAVRAARHLVPVEA